jgi:hypothetical protein
MRVHCYLSTLSHQSREDGGLILDVVQNRCVREEVAVLNKLYRPGYT